MKMICDRGCSVIMAANPMPQDWIGVTHQVKQGAIIGDILPFESTRTEVLIQPNSDSGVSVRILSTLRLNLSTGFVDDQADSVTLTDVLGLCGFPGLHDVHETFPFRFDVGGSILPTILALLETVFFQKNQ